MGTDFEDARRLLADAGVAVDAAEIHGMVCGLLCTPTPPDPRLWVDEVLGDASVSTACQGWFEELRDHANAGLDSPECDFSPLLPDDTRPIEERLGALARWCSGFLYGVGLGGAGRRDAQREEVLIDVGEIARLDARAADGEEAERGLVELVEFVRVGMMLLRAGARGDDQEE